MIGALRTALLPIVALVLLLAPFPQAQGTAPPTALTLISRDGRRPVPTTVVNGQELIALDDVATLFQVAVREDTLTGGVTLAYMGRTVVLSRDQPMASVNGRIVPLPAPATRVGRRWLVPLDFLTAALGPLLDTRLELRRVSRLVLLGDVRVPRVTARIDAAGPPTRATIEISPVAPTIATVEAGRITVRIDADALDLAAPAAGGGLIDAIRGDQPASLVVVLSPRYMTARAVTSNVDGVTRVAIEVSSATTSTDAPAVTPAAPAPTAAAPTTPGPPPLLAASRPAVQAIVIDAGHGGEDAGVHGPAGLLEKQVTLDVARRLRALIETRLGVRVIMTRDDDRTVTLDERAAIANNGKAGIFLSLHANASLAASASGAEVFGLQLDREGEAVRQLATAQEVNIPVLGGGTRPIDVIRWDLAQARHVEASAVLAARLEQELRKHVPMGQRAIRQAPMRVLAGVNMPAALVEMGYLTNPDQERAFRSSDFPGLVAQSLFDAIVGFRDYLAEQRTP
jgi:N-acetylmuramoyl-L-alanine amidase